MIWHYLRIIFVILVAAHSCIGLVHAARSGELRRVWNWPMKIAIASWLFAGLLGWAAAWIRTQPGGAVMGSDFGIAAIAAVMVGIVSLMVFLGGFLVTILRDLKPKNRAVPVQEEIDQIQVLLESGQKEEAVKLYQQQNSVSRLEAEASIDAIDRVLQAGLRV